MKKAIVFLLLITLFIPNITLGTPLDFTGGVQNEYKYEEIVFITGEPIKFTGTYSVSEKEKDNELSVTYKFKLTTEDTSLNGKLDRTITYTTIYDKHNNVGQTIGQTTVTKYKETIKFDKDTYELKDYQFSKSDVIDERPASTFYSGNFKGRKYYEYNKNGGYIIIEITGGNVGYENFWGSTETQIVDNIIEANIYPTDESDGESWTGTYSYQVSDSMTKSLRYSENDATFSSFNGGYIRITERETVSRYSYNLPNAKGTISLNQEMVPKLERLIVPKFRDVNGHWAEEYIEKLYSLDVFDDNSDIFAPDVPMTRLDFTKAIMRACDIRATMEEEKATKRISRKKTEAEPSYFTDISTDNPDYQYIKAAVDKGIIKGISKDLFGPKKSLTRAEAVTILIRALGFESKAPNPGYITSFSDDRQIPSWAKDSIYMAKEIGLIQGDTLNRANPNQALTRAEASALIVRFLEFLEKDLQKDYRENIINYY